MPRSCFEFCRISGSQEASTRSHPEPSIDKVSLRLVWDSIASLKAFAKEMQFSLNTLWLFDSRFPLTPGMHHLEIAPHLWNSGQINSPPSAPLCRAISYCLPWGSNLEMQFIFGDHEIYSRDPFD